MSSAALLIATSFPAFSQQNSADSNVPKNGKTPQQVVISAATSTYDPRRDDTATRNVVTQNEIRQYGDTRLLDVLKRIPGVSVSGNSVQLRGLGSGYTQILLNGDRPPPGFSLDELNPSLVERIEVMQVATADLSTQAVAGTINIVLNRAISTTKQEVRLSYGGERKDRGPSVTLQISDKTDVLGYSLGVNVRHSDEYGLITDEETGHNADNQLVLSRRSLIDSKKISNTSLNLTPRINFVLGGGDQLNLQGFLTHSLEDNEAEGESITAVGPELDYPGVAYKNDIRSSRGRLDVNWVKNFEEGRLEAKVTAGGGSSVRETLSQGFLNSGRLGRKVEITRDNDYREYSSQGKYTRHQRFAFGWDAGYKTTKGLWGQTDQVEQSNSIVADTVIARANVARLAAFAQGEWNLRPHWSLYLGGRWEGIATETSGSTYSTSKTYDHVLSPVVQTLYKIPDSNGRQLRAALTRTYRAPNANDLVPSRLTQINNSPSTPDYVGNPQLRAELATGFDVAYEHFWAEGALFSIAVAHRDHSNHFRWVVSEERAGHWVSKLTNVGDAQSQSLALELKFPLKAILSGAPLIDVKSSLNRNWSKVYAVPGPSNTLERQVPLTGTFGLDYRVGSLTVGGTAIYHKGGLSRVSTIQTSYLQYRRQLDIFASWKYSPQTQLRLSASNLTGLDRINDNTFIEQIGVVRRTNRIPAGPRFILTLEHKFNP